MTQKKNTLFIVDGSYLLYRSFYAIRPLYTASGIPTQATYGFARALKKIIDDFDVKELVIAWDAKGPTFRKEIYQEYKATRQAPPSELIVQKNDIIELISSLGICQVAQQGFEADDIIYSLVQDNPQQNIILVCPDKDLFQLLNDHVKIFDPFKGRVIDRETYEQEKGLPVTKISFYYALLGDTSDNIPGVSGVGEKTALDLVNQFDSLEDLYARLDHVKKERVRTLLETQKEKAFLSLQLFTLKYCETNASKDFAFNEASWIHAAPMFKRLEFKSLLQEIEREFPQACATEAGNAAQQSSIFAEPTPEKPQQNWECVLVETQEGLDQLIAEIRHTGACAFDTETTGLAPLQDALVGVSFALGDNKGYYIPVGHKSIDSHRQLPLETVLEKLKPVLEDAKIKKYLHNAKFDELVLFQYGVSVRGVTFDTILAANLLRNAWQKINLKDLSSFFLHETMQTYEETVGKAYKTFAEVPIERGARYGAHDALQTFKLQKVFAQMLAAEPKLLKLFDELEMPLLPILANMEAQGIFLDTEELKAVGKALVRECNAVEVKFFAALDGVVNPLSFNLNSPKQVEFLLFDQLKLPVIKKSPQGQRSTDQEVLQELALHSPVAGLIARHRELRKLITTYIEPLPTFINPKTGKIHTSYSQTIVATGRLSSSNPNLQNIPTGTDFGLKIRSAFKPDAGKIFISADYSQVELRVLAHLSKDAALIDAFLHDRDIHIQTASQLFGTPASQVTNQQRQLGKKINFSIIYGLTPFGLSKDLGIKPAEAKAYIEKYFAQYPAVATWLAHTVAQATELGYVQTEWGRRRWVPGLKEKNRNLYEAEKRVATNTPVQGTAADIMKLAMLKVDAAIKKSGLDAQIILQIHDELVVQALPQDQDALVELVCTQMERVVTWDVPLKVTTRIGANWGDVSK